MMLLVGMAGFRLWKALWRTEWKWLKIWEKRTYDIYIW